MFISVPKNVPKKLRQVGGSLPWPFDLVFRFGGGRGVKISERSAVEACQLHGLSNRCGDGAHLVGLCALLHDAMQHLQ